MGNENQETTGTSSKSRRGLTLIEVSLVIALIIVMAAFCWPAINKAFSIQRLKKSADIVRMQLCKARVKAMSSDRIVTFRYEMAGSRFRIEQLADVTSFENIYDGMTPDGDAMHQTPLSDDSPMTSPQGASPNTDYPPGGELQALPKGIVFHACEIENDSRAMTAGDNLPKNDPTINPFAQINWSAPIYFYPDGTSSSAQLQICNDRNAAIVISLRGMTGVVKFGEIVPVEGVMP